jgi:hypothetical protein
MLQLKSKLWYLVVLDAGFNEDNRQVEQKAGV